MQRANSRQPTGIVDGLASLGEAFLARGAINKADKVDQDYASAQAAQQKSIADLLMQSGDYTPEQKALIASGAPGVREMMMKRAFAEPERHVLNDQLYDTDGNLLADARDPQSRTAGNYYQNENGEWELAPYTARPTDPAKLAIDQQRADAATLSAQASMQRAQQNAEELGGPDIDGESKLRKEFTNITGDYRSVSDEYRRLLASAALNNSQGDLALVVGITKMLDPGSVAREGEVQLSQSSASLLGQIRTWIPQLEKGGTLLPDETRAGFVNLANELNQSYQVAMAKRVEEYTRLSNDYGFNPERILIGSNDPRPPQAQPETMQQPRTVSAEELSTLNEGATIEDEKTGQRFQIRNGVPVPIE